MGHVRDRWMVRDPKTGRKIKGPRHGRGLRWQARWVDANGVERTQMCATADEARDLVAATRVNPLLGSRPRPVGFATYAEQWSRSQLHHRPSTQESTSRVIDGRLLPAFAGLDLAQLTRARVRQEVVSWSQRYAPATVHVTVSVLSSILDAAVEDGHLDANPCRGVKLPAKGPGRVFIPTTDQVVELRRRITPAARSMVVVAAASGLRSGELRGLRVGNAGRVLQVVEQLDPTGVTGPPKSRNGVRSVDIGAAAWSELRPVVDGRRPDELVWTARGGQALSRSTQIDRWRRASAGLGFPPGTGWHALRHYHASMLIAAGLSPVAVAARLGNSVRETMETYAHLWPSDEDRIVAAVDAELRVVCG